MNELLSHDLKCDLRNQDARNPRKKSDVDRDSRPSHYLAEPYEEEALFKNRPHTTLVFERQLDRIFHWTADWDFEKKCTFVEQLLQVCNYMIIRFLWTVLEPLVHRDFIYNKFDPFPGSTFHTLSSYITRELYGRLEKIVNKYRRKRGEVYRIPSSIVKDEASVKGWASESVLPVIKGFENEKILESRLTLTRSKASPSVTKDKSALPLIQLQCSTSVGSRHASRRQKSLNDIPLRHQTKQRHLQQDELYQNKPQKDREVIFRSSHERSHMKVFLKTRSCSSLDSYKESRRDCKPRNTRSQTSLSTFTTTFAKSETEDKHDKILIQWFHNHWNDWQKKEFLQLFIQTLDTGQLYLLYGLIMVRLYRDFISLLPRNLSIKVLSYLPPTDLLKVAKVSHKWKELASDNELWRLKCRERRVGLSQTPVNWKDMYIRYDNLEENWCKGKYTVTEFLGHTGSVISVQLYKNLLASGSVDKTIKIWNTDTGELVQTLKGHSKGVWGLRFMSRTLLISCSNDHTIKIWNLRTNTCARTFLGHDGGVWCIERKGDLLVSGSVDKTARLWNLRHCRLKATFSGHSGAIFGIDFDPQRGFVFTGSADKTIRMWNMVTTECVKCIMISSGHHPVTAVGYHEGVLACSFGNNLSLWDTHTWENIGDFKGHKERIEALQISSREANRKRPLKVIVSCSRDGKIKYWNAESCVCLNSFRGHEDAITSVVFDEARIVTASQDCIVKLWNFLS
ncbi:uncharacterized protein LOC135683371 [Rhopilema esculentum]|uniref:uncharacterized protein LOC135683371 n=1 Tax=Rhopilema esculentum TaxID=499914 RepID=UPI0031DE583C